MPEHRFTLILSGIEEATEEAAEALYASFDDGTLASSGGVAHVGFARQGETFLGAIRSAIQDVRKAGFDVSRVEIEAAAFEDV